VARNFDPDSDLKFPLVAKKGTTRGEKIKKARYLEARMFAKKTSAPKENIFRELILLRKILISPQERSKILLTA
jgi:hypothetical protein